LDISGGVHPLEFGVKLSFSNAVDIKDPGNVEQLEVRAQNLDEVPHPELHLDPVANRLESRSVLIDVDVDDDSSGS